MAARYRADRPDRPPRGPFDIAVDADTPVYVISVAAQLTGLHPQTLRGYDRIGLVSPGRSGGGGRRYSLRDIEMLRRVIELTADGIGLEGVRRILALEAEVDDLQARVDDLRGELAQVQSRLERSLDETPYLPEPFTPRSNAVVVWRSPSRRR